MWACGIIMYILIEKGKHPLYERGKDNEEMFLKKLQNP